MQNQIHIQEIATYMIAGKRKEMLKRCYLKKMVEMCLIHIQERSCALKSVVRQIKRGHIRQIKSGLIHGNCQKTVGLSSLISSDYKKKKLPMQIKTQAAS